MKQVIFAIALLYTFFGCTKKVDPPVIKQEIIIKLIPPYVGIDSTYAGQPALRYSDTAVARISKYCQPKGFYVVYRNPMLYFIKIDTLQKVDNFQYKNDVIKPFAQEIYPQIFGDKAHPNHDAQMTVSSLNFRIGFSEDVTNFPPDYTLEYNIPIIDPMFDKIKFF